MKHRLWIVGGAVAALLLLLGGVAWAAESGQAPVRLQDRVVRGTVTSVDEEEIELETADGQETTLLVGEATRLWVPGQPPTTTIELSVGDPVVALGQPATSETGSRAFSARLIVVASEEDLPKLLIRGRAVAVTRQTIVVQTGNRERAITVLPRTRLWSPSGRVESLRDVHPGDLIIALGQPTELGQWVAGVVLIVGRQPPGPRGLQGEVTDLDAQTGTLTLQTERRGEVTVLTDDDTSYRIPGVEDPGFDDIEVGDRVVVVGRPDEENPDTLLARGVGVLPSPEERRQSSISDR